MNIRFLDVPKHFKAMCALVLLHGCLIVIDNLSHMLQGFYALAMIVTLLVVVVSLLIGYLVLTRGLFRALLSEQKASVSPNTVPQAVAVRLNKSLPS